MATGGRGATQSRDLVGGSGMLSLDPKNGADPPRIRHITIRSHRDRVCIDAGVKWLGWSNVVKDGI